MNILGVKCSEISIPHISISSKTILYHRNAFRSILSHLILSHLTLSHLSGSITSHFLPYRLIPDVNILTSFYPIASHFASIQRMPLHSSPLDLISSYDTIFHLNPSHIPHSIQSDHILSYSFLS